MARRGACIGAQMGAYAVEHDWHGRIAGAHCRDLSRLVATGAIDCAECDTDRLECRNVQRAGVSANAGHVARSHVRRIPRGTSVGPHRAARCRRHGRREHVALGTTKTVHHGRRHPLRLRHAALGLYEGRRRLVYLCRHYVGEWVAALTVGQASAVVTGRFACQHWQRMLRSRRGAERALTLSTLR